MNRKGQSLVLFVILIPVLICIFALIFDSALIVTEHVKLKNISRDTLSNIMIKKGNIEDVKLVILKNDQNIKIIEINDNQVHLMKYLDSYFGKAIGYDKYEIEVNYTGYYENGDLRIKEMGK